MKQFIRILVVIIAGILSSCNDSDKNEQGTSSKIKDAEKTPKVEVVTPKERTFLKTLEIVGEARPNQIVKLRALENGAVARLYKDIGDKVKEGEVLASLRNPAITGNLNVLEAKLEATKSKYERLNDIYEKTPALTSLSQVESAKSDYQSTLAEYNASREQVGFLQIRSPFNGIVTERNIDKGATVQSGIANPGSTPLFEVMDTEIIRVRVPLPESDVKFVKQGTAVSIKFPELPDENFQGEVSRVSGALDSGSKSMSLEIDIKNPDLKIKPGMYAQTNFEVKSTENTLSLPNTALAVRDEKMHIYVVSEDNIVQLREVAMGIQNKDYFEVLSDEIDTSTKVIVSGKRQVDPGMQVEPIEIER
ncbi:efflux RND transporter periplasmic adaptor subunit [Salegentibacter sp. JZCK2]|uniref:efflux RND transporter periplasmic adaptor subunit n=1 Tax=Salegentibacter tibetensis TaxID=2873600 RepID=UPI001CCE221C|nr:efflux RND transporter periplasmic adaptor subunit [Salegentibacter tibetensis]MBZ9730862.1 efflux RND transporter periplasmic adaptor subunit [Salegentibacter tibetensis]